MLYHILLFINFSLRVYLDLDLRIEFIKIELVFCANFLYFYNLSQLSYLKTALGADKNKHPTKIYAFSMNIPIFIINLRRCPDRKLQITRQLQRMNLAYEIVEAIDGNDISDNEMAVTYKDVIFYRGFLHSRYLEKGEIGCLLSHLKVFRKIVENDIAFACILEDDVILEKDFPGILDLNVHSDKNWDILLIGHLPKYENKKTCYVDCVIDEFSYYENYFMGIPIEHPKGTHAYIIKKETAKKILDYAYPIRMPADFLWVDNHKIGVKLSLLTPPLAFQDREHFPSTIYNREKPQYINPIMSYYRITKLYVKKKFPTLFPVLKTGRLCFDRITKAPVVFYRKSKIIKIPKL